MNFSHAHFAEPRWLWLGVLAPLLLIALQGYAAWQRQRQLKVIASAELIAGLTRSHSRLRRAFKNILLVLATAGIGIALARPQWGVHEFAAQELGEDVIFAIDCSRSMLAGDVSPNRLERAKLAVMEFARRHGQRRLGLVAFSGQAFLQCPLTFDYDAFEDSLRMLDDKIISQPGTDIGRALDESFQAMEKKDRRKVLILLTDGEDLEQSGLRTAEALAKRGVVVFTIGVGTPTGSEIRILNEQNQPELVRDAQGEPVRSRLDDTTLKAIATATGGDYFPLGGLGEGLARVRLALETNSSASLPVRKLGIDRFHVFVAVVLVLLVMESLIGTRRRDRGQPARGNSNDTDTTRGRAARAPIRVSAGPLLIAGLWLSFSTFAADPVFMDFTNTTATPAVSEPMPETPRELFNGGTKNLSAGKLADAEAMLTKALESQDEKVQAPALYNLGHTRFAQGTELMKKSPTAKSSSSRGRAAAQQADRASGEAQAALAGSDVQKMLEAYLNGRGARKELKSATEAIRRALDLHGATLRRWQRSLDDFKSAAELNPAKTNAQRNAQLVEREIARLVDSIREMQQTAAQMAQSQKKLQEQMKQLGGKIPEPMMPPGAKGEDEEEDEGEKGKQPPQEPQSGQHEKPGREGEAMMLSPEEAGWLLEGFKLDSDHRLPMGQGKEAEPKDRKGRNW